MRAVPVLLIALLAAVLIAGCINKIASTQQYTQDYASGLSARVPVADSADATACKDAKCMCMVCKKGTTFFGFLTSFAGGNCYFKKPCNSTEIYDLAKGTSTSGKDLVPNYFRIGQGPSFADFGEANAYCNSRLGMAVQWLVGNKDAPYSLPTARRAVCLLDKGIMPVYVLYSNGENIDPVQTMKIAAVLGTEGDDVTAGKLTGAVGPVIITTEINYDVSQAEKIKEQIRQINAGCQQTLEDRKKNLPVHCLVAVAPKLGDKEALKAVLSDKDIADQVDLVAYGIDSNRLNFKGYCNQPSIAWENATTFSSYALYEWGKPSVIPYVLFDAAGTDANTDPATQCKWNEATMIEGYMQFFNSFVMTLPDKGVIGVAPYAFKSSAFPGSNPLGCADCDLGKNDYRKAAWYAGCQAYTTLSLKATASTYQKGAPGTLLSFPDNPSGSCQDSTADIYSLLANREYQDKDFTQIRQPTLQQAQEVYLRCDECISNSMRDPPFKFPKKTVADLDTTCNKYPELDSFAGQRSLDPTFVRAVVATESINFNPCSAAKVCKGGYTDAGCFGIKNPATGNDECYGEAYSSMSDPAAPPCPLTNAPNSGSSQPNWRWCGLGLMQSLEPPYTYWPARYSGDGKDGTNVAVFNDAWARGMDTKADMELAKACNPKNFNPFNPTDSACVGTAKLAEKMRAARTRVAVYHNTQGVNLLNWKPTEIDKDNVFIAYVAANLYVGSWKNDWVDDFFLNGWSITPDFCTQNPSDPRCKGKGQPDTENCYGRTDPVDFIDCRIAHNVDGYPSSDRGAAKMGVYYYLTKNCKNSFCPDWKRLYDAAKWPGKPIVPIEDDPLSNPT